MTFQIRERFVEDGQDGHIMEGVPQIPQHPRILDTGDFGTFSACWRGYVGKWKVQDGKLYLAGVSGRYSLVDDQPVPCDGLTGTMKVIFGSLGGYRQMLPEEQVRLNRFYRFEDGRLMSSWQPGVEERLEIPHF